MPELLECRQRTRVAALIDNRARRFALPVGPLEEVDKVDADEGVFGLPNLPVGTSAVPLELLAESAYPVGHRLVRRRVSQESANPADAVRRGLLLDEARLQEELAEPLQRCFELAHGHTSVAAMATDVPRSDTSMSSAITLGLGVLSARAALPSGRTREPLSTRGCQRPRAIGALHLSRAKRA